MAAGDIKSNKIDDNSSIWKYPSSHFGRIYKLNTSYIDIPVVILAGDL